VFLDEELNSLRPIAYTGYNTLGPGGHAFVCDGYDNWGLYHFNWGWGGSQDGYFAITDLTPSSYDFGGNNRIALGLMCDETSLFGCMDENASNYNPSATFDDDSCEYDCEFLLSSESIYLGIGVSNNGCDLYFNMGYTIDYLESIGYACECVDTGGGDGLTYVPDDVFENHLINEGYDDVLDDYVLTSNISNITMLNLPGFYGLADLTGLEDFVSLLWLGVGHNPDVTEIDLSTNTELEFVFLNHLSISELDVSNQLELRVLTVGNSSATGTLSIQVD
jgi:hypothetical protein